MHPENDNDAITTANLLGRIGRGWDDLQGYIGTLSREQLTGPADDAGWTVKDHLIHMAVWEDGIAALLGGSSRLEAMGVDQASWEQGADAANEVIYARYRDMPLDDVLSHCQQAHGRLLERIKAMSDADLLRPYGDF
ncbi:MAG TPA: maleylpyruvate isomerase N-terminal domain-containing protein, partial [Herpetosiphonaceae bacterium]|nr:maleylpyruvate isomerase N-terminal domain-containing protein [Herpetosiphonaceae bacterium]